LLEVVIVLHLFREHIGDNEDLLREALVLVDKNLLILKVFVLLFLDLLCCFQECESKFLATLLGLVELFNHVAPFQFDVLVELEFLNQSIHGALESLIWATQSRLIIISNCSMLGSVINNVEGGLKIWLVVMVRSGVRVPDRWR